MYSSYHINISVAANGFVVTYTDPGRVEKNRDSDKYVDPDVSVVFEDANTMARGISKLVPKMAEAMEKDMDFDQGLADALSEGSGDSESN